MKGERPLGRGVPRFMDTGVVDETRHASVPIKPVFRYESFLAVRSFTIIRKYLELISPYGSDIPCGVFVWSGGCTRWPVPEREPDAEIRHYKKRL